MNNKWYYDYMLKQLFRVIPAYLLPFFFLTIYLVACEFLKAGSSYFIGNVVFTIGAMLGSYYLYRLPIQGRTKIILVSLIPLFLIFPSPQTNAIAYYGLMFVCAAFGNCI